MKIRTVMVLLGWLTVSLSGSPALAQEKGAGSIGVEYQYIHSDVFKDDLGEYDYWSTDTKMLMLSGDYTFADNWTVFVALPYIEKRFVDESDWGGDPHNPNDAWWIDFVPPDKRFWDDGSYHGGWQDMSLTISYQALDGPLTLSPYIGYGFPVGDYPFYAKAAIGADLWTIPVGASFSYIPYFDDWYVSGNVAYVFSEKPVGVNVDFWSVHLSGGYWFRPDFSVNVFAGLRYVIDGLTMPWGFSDDPTYSDYPDAYDTELWYNHDRLLQNRNLNMGVGFNYFLNEKYSVSGSFYKGVWAAHSSEPGRAFTLGIARHFGGD